MLLGELDRDSESLSIALSVQQCMYNVYCIRCTISTMYNAHCSQFTLHTISSIGTYCNAHYDTSMRVNTMFQSKAYKIRRRECTEFCARIIGSSVLLKIFLKIACFKSSCTYCTTCI